MSAHLPSAFNRISIKALFRMGATLFLLSLLNACAWFQFPGVYRLDIQQGNIITQEMVDQLQIGMTKRQVNFVLGTPLIQDSFNLDRWDYYYSLSNTTGELSRQRFITYFESDVLVRVEGDYQLNDSQINTDALTSDSPESNIDRSQIATPTAFQ